MRVRSAFGEFEIREIGDVLNVFLRDLHAFLPQGSSAGVRNLVGNATDGHIQQLGDLVTVLQRERFQL